MRWRILVGVTGLVASVMLAARPAAAERRWGDLSPEEQHRALENYQRLQRVPSQKREKVERRFQRFQSMPQAEQERLRRNYETFRGLGDIEQRRLRERYRRWKFER